MSFQASHIPVYPTDIYSVTGYGRQELNRGSTALSLRELEMLVLMDGKLTAKELMERLPQVEEWDFVEILRKLIGEDLVAKASIEVQDGLDFSYFFDSEKTVPTALMLSQAFVETDTGVPELKRDGYYVSIARRAAGAPPPSPGKKITVLTVEDDPSISMLVVTVLRGEGYDVRTASNRSEILSALRSLPSPDLVLLDVHLPDANGFDILERMKQHPALLNIPVLMLSGEATREDVAHGLVLGADGYITKPFDIPVLRRGIKTVLGIA